MLSHETLHFKRAFDFDFAEIRNYFKCFGIEEASAEIDSHFCACRGNKGAIPKNILLESTIPQLGDFQPSTPAYCWRDNIVRAQTECFRLHLPPDAPYEIYLSLSW